VVWLRRGISIILILSLLVLCALVHFWFFPGKWIQTQSANYILDKYLSETLSYDRDSFELQVSTPDFWRRHIQFHMDELCLNLTDAEPLCLQSLSFSLRLHLLNRPYLIEEIESFELKAQKLVLPKMTAEPKEPQAAPVSPLERLAQAQAIIAKLQWQHILIELPHLELLHDDGATVIQLNIQSPSPNQILSELKVEHPLMDGQWSFVLNPVYNTNEIKLQFSGSILPKTIDMIDRLTLDQCELAITDSLKSAQLALNCPLTTHLKMPSQLDEKVYGFPELKVLKWHTKVELALGPLIKQKKGELQLEFKLFPIASEFLEAQLDGSLLLAVNLEEDWQSWHMDPNLNLAVKVPHWQKWVKQLRGSALPIPPPFHVLDGPATINVQGNPVEMSQTDHWRIPLRLNTKLKNDQHQLILEALAEVLIPRHIKKVEEIELNAILEIKQWDIPLPPLDPLHGIPNVSHDPRFMSREKALSDSASEISQLAKETPFQLPFKTHLEIKTTNPKSLRLFYQYVDPFVPIGIRIQANEKLKPHGHVVISPFALSYLRRTAHVESLELELPRNPLNPINIQGQVRVDVDIYKIYFKMKGTLEHPGLDVWSVPSLSRQDIFSLLLYNRLRSDLSDEEATNVGGTENAFADQAIGLFSLWALASTPIQSVSYNPDTQTYNARVQLGEGTTMAVGGDFEQVQTLELKRRLTGNLFLTTLFRPGEVSEGRVFIEWQKRFGSEAPANKKESN
jgi:hypothetical protein